MKQIFLPVLIASFVQFFFSSGILQCNAQEGEDSLTPALVIDTKAHPDANQPRMFQGIPSVTLSPGGRLWAIWYGGGKTEGDENYCMVATSNDRGDHWTDPILRIDVPGSVRTYDPAAWTDPEGNVRLFWAQSQHWWDGRSGVWSIWTDQGDEENAPWSVPMRLSDGIMLNKPIVDSQNRWLYPVSVWTLEPTNNAKTLPVGAHLLSSHDQGQSCQLLGSTLITQDPLFDEHHVVELKDGRLKMWIRTKSGIAESLSSDGGRTWTSPVPSSIQHTSSRFFIRRLASGNILLVKHGPIDTDCGRSQLTAYLSKDETQTWEGKLVLDERDGVSYPDGDQWADGMICVIYDRDRYGDQEILMARFTEADILAEKLLSEGSALKCLVNRAEKPLENQKEEEKKVEENN